MEVFAIDDIRKKYGVPGLAGFKVGESSAVVSGYRKVGHDTEISPNDLFHLGSLTKMMTATLIGKQIDKGLLRWNMSMGEVFPDLDATAEFKKITIEQMTSHRSGLTGNLIEFLGVDGFNGLREFNDKPSQGRQFLLKKLAKTKPNPGEYTYSNAGYTILGLVLEQLLKKSWQSVIEEELFKPLGMTSCGFGPPAKQNQEIPDQPWAHEKKSDGYHPMWSDNPYVIGPAGYVHCSLKDLAQFVQMHIDGSSGKSNFLKPETFLKLHSPAGVEKVTFGSWIRITHPNGGEFLQAAGSNTLNFALVWIDLKKYLGFLAASNAGDDNAFKATDEVIARLMELGAKD